VIRDSTASISVVLVTYRRPEACERALQSVLAQTVQPSEILVCDDCSRDRTEEIVRGWEAKDPRIRYLCTSVNSGAPAATRNLGVSNAHSDWIAFLDDDDEWLPRKLERQSATLSAEPVDVVSSNALRRDGTRYFPDAPEIFRPGWADLTRANPVLVCSALVRRASLVDVGGFPTASWTVGIDDYAAWLELGRRGSKFIVIGEPLVRYEDQALDRLSYRRIHSQIGVTRLSWRYGLGRPTLAGISSAMKNTAGVLQVAGQECLGRVRRSE
jgi:glycosyltransferase involved in cell wall biosynthesis